MLWFLCELSSCVPFHSLLLLWLRCCQNLNEILFISIDGESQSLETLFFEVLEFMSMDWDSLVTLLLSISFISVSKVQTEVEAVSSVISIGVFRSTDRCVSIRDWCAGDRNSDCCVPLIDCCASGTDNDWFLLRNVLYIYIKCSYSLILYLWLIFISYIYT